MGSGFAILKYGISGFDLNIFGILGLISGRDSGFEGINLGISGFGCQFLREFLCTFFG